jgi:hypothetical protein
VQPSVSHQTFISAPITAKSLRVIEDKKYKKEIKHEGLKKKKRYKLLVNKIFRHRLGKVGWVNQNSLISDMQIRVT